MKLINRLVNWRLAIILLLLSFSACIRSLYPLYTADDLVFSSDLIGTWLDDDNNTWTFTVGDKYQYDLIVSEEGHPAQFKTHLLELGDHLFLDTFPYEPSVDNDFYKLHLVGAHLFARMEIFTDSCHYTLMDHDWLETILSESIESLAYEMVDDAIILTAKTPELQAFFRKYANDPEAFKDRTLLVRKN